MEIDAVSDKCEVVQEGDVEEKVGKFLFEADEERLEDEGKEEGAKRVALLTAGRTGNPGGAEKKVRGVGIAGLRPCRRLGAMPSNLLQHGFATYAVKGIFKVQEKEPLVLDFNVVVVKDGVGGVDDGFRSALDADADLKRGQMGLCVGDAFLGDAFRRPAAESFADGNRAMTPYLYCM